MSTSTEFEAHIAFKLLPERQQRMLILLRSPGFAHFIQELKLIADQELTTPDQKQCWRTIREALEPTGSTKGYFYLRSIHHSLLRAFISGSLTSQMKSDMQLAYIAQQHANLVAAPGAYINVVCRKSFTPHPDLASFRDDKDPSRWNGYGVSINQLRQVCEAMHQYGAATPQYASTARRIDSAVSGIGQLKAGAKKHILERRFLPTQQSCNVVQSWADWVQRKVVDKSVTLGIDPDEPLPWCFQECGWGVSLLARAMDHQSQTSTNYLLGLFFSTLEHLFPGFFELRAFRFQVVNEPQDADLIESLAHLITGSFSCTPYFGLNPTWPGGMAMIGPNGLKNDKYAEGFARGKALLIASPTWRINATYYAELEQEFLQGRQAVRSAPARKEQAADTREMADEAKRVVQEYKDSIQHGLDDITGWMAVFDAQANRRK